MLVFLRHGETVFNRAGRWQGQIDSALTDKGRAQALVSANKLAEIKVQKIISSPLGRAKDTAAIAGDCLALPVLVDERLMEVGSGVCEGLTQDEIETRWPGFITWRARDRWNRAPEGGETYSAARKRLIAFAEDEELAGEIGSPGPVIVIVGHSRSLAILSGALLGWTDARVVDTYPPNATPLVVADGDLKSL